MVDDTTRVDSHKVLLEMLDNASTDRSKRYVVCALTRCNYRDKELVMLASDWVTVVTMYVESSLLLPHSPFTRAYKSKTPDVSPHSAINLPETQASQSFLD